MSPHGQSQHYVYNSNNNDNNNNNDTAFALLSHIYGGTSSSSSGGGSSHERIGNGFNYNDNHSVGFHHNDSNASQGWGAGRGCQGLDCHAPAFFHAVTAVTVCLAFLGGLGNALTVLAILTSRLRHNINCILICNLSLADTLYCLLLLPMQASAFYYRDWRLGTTVCELHAALRIWLIGVNMTLLSCIAFYRFLHVVHNNAYTCLSRTSLFSLAVLICWAFPFFFSFTPLVGWWGTFSFQDKILQCTFDTHSNKTHKLTVITLGYVIPCVFILVCYARIGCVVFTSRKRTSRGSVYRRQRAKRESFRLTAMMVFIFLGFLLGTTPFFLINTLDKSLQHPAPHIWSPVLAWFMYSLNPVIYTVMDAQFQAAYRRLVLCQVWRKSYPGGTAAANDMASYQERNSSITKKPITAPDEEQ